MLGPNGSGKSTLLKLILKNLSPNKGEISLLIQISKIFLLKNLPKFAALCPKNQN
ncbi:ATP-binding cassette domain-containing protein [Campylobacter jejuni]